MMMFRWYEGNYSPLEDVRFTGRAEHSSDKDVINAILSVDFIAI